MRLSNWPARLADELRAADERPFSFQGLVCLTFAAACARAITGIDYAARFPFADEAGAQKILDDHGGVEGLLTALLGPPCQTARVGDVVTADLSEGLHVGVHVGKRIAFYCSDGLRYGALSQIRNAWAIG